MQVLQTTLLTGPYDWDSRSLPKAEFEARVLRVRAALAAAGADALLVHGIPGDYGALAYLTNFVPKLGLAVALVPQEGDIRLIVSGTALMLTQAKLLTWVDDLKPASDVPKLVAGWCAERGAARLGLWGARTMAHGLRRGIVAALGREPLVLDDALDAIRRHKSTRELGLMREASRILARASGAFISSARSGAGARTAALAFERAAVAAGAQDARTLASAHAGGPPLPIDGPEDRVLDPLLAALAVQYAGYWAEGLVTIAAQPGAGLTCARAALAAMLRQAKPGASACFAAARRRGRARRASAQPLSRRGRRFRHRPLARGRSLGGRRGARRGRHLRAARRRRRCARLGADRRRREGAGNSLVVAMMRALAAAAALAVLAALPAVAAETLVVGKAAPNAFSFVPLDIGVAKGFFARQGIEIQSLGFSGSAKIHQAMAAGNLDIGLAAGSDLVFPLKGAPEIAVADMAGPPLLMSFIVPWNSPAKSADDLKGKRIGISTVNSLTQWLALELARQKGWGPDGLTFVTVGAEPAPQVAALVTGQIDALVSATALGLRLETEQRGRDLFPASDVAKVFMIHAIYASNKIVEQQSRPGARLSQGVVRDDRLHARQQGRDGAPCRARHRLSARDRAEGIRHRHADVLRRRQVRSRRARRAAPLVRRAAPARCAARSLEGLDGKIPAGRELSRSLNRASGRSPWRCRCRRASGSTARNPRSWACI